MLGDKDKDKKKQQVPVAKKFEKDPSVTGPLTWQESYMNSPEFKRKANSFNISDSSIEKMKETARKIKPYKLPDNYTKITKDEILGSRAWNDDFTNAINSTGSPLNIPKGTSIILDPVQAKNLGMSTSGDVSKDYLINDVFPHEIGHLIGRDLNPLEEASFITANKDSQAYDQFISPEYKEWRKGRSDLGSDNKNLSIYMKLKGVHDNSRTHDNAPDEQYSDLNALRYLMYKREVYDARKGQMTPEDLQKAKKDEFIKNSYLFKRLQKHFSDDDIIKLNNTIAQNDNSDEQTTAKNGTYMKVDFKQLLAESLPDAKDIATFTAAKSGIHIKPSKKGTFTAAANKHGKSVQSFAAQVLSNKTAYSPAMRKKANFARNASKWHHGDNGLTIDTSKIPLPEQGTITNDTLQYDLPTGNNNFLGDDIAAGLGLVDALIPSDKAQRKYVQPQEVYNQHPYGTDSQAIMKGGGIIPDDLSPFQPFEAGGPTADKAKEILRDGTANGKKLTAKQKKYFGWVAGGSKADMGMGIDPGDPVTSVNSKQMINNQAGARNESLFRDMVNYGISTGNNPLQGEEAKMLRLSSTGVLRDPKNKSVVDAVFAFNQRGDLAGKNPQQRLESFYSMNSDNPSVQRYRDISKNAGYGPPPKRVETYDPNSSQNETNAVNSAPTTGPTYNLSDMTTHTIANSQKKSPIFKGGGIMKYDNGGDLQTHWGGEAEQASENPYDGGTIQFSGASHENGGVGMSYNGKGVEVEGGETAVRDADGTLNIMGNMTIPGSKMKFKTLSKKIAKQEEKYQGLKDTGTQLVNNFDPENKFDRLKFNAGNIMMKGGDMGQRELAKKKADLSAVQKAMLDTADEFNLDPLHFSEGKIKKAKKGAYIKAAGGFSLDGTGDPTVSDRHNNPGNIKYGKFARQHGAVRGEPSSDGGYFAKFPDKASGAQAMKDLLTTGKAYKDSTVSSAIDTWTNHKPYNYNLGATANKKISELTPQELDTVMNTMTQGEGTRYGDKSIPPTKTLNKYQSVIPGNFSMGNLDFTTPPQGTPNKVNPPALGHLYPDSGRKIPSNVEGLNPLEVLPEIYGAATNKEEVVKAQQFNPELFVPYQVSFQDRLDANQSTFSAASRAASTNPSAASVIAAGQYQANNAVNAEEFRTNQGISNDVANKNIGILNAAQQENLGIGDQQYVRQQQAKSKTKEQNQLILNSLSSKYLQNRLENKTLAAYENLYDYRFVDTNNDGIPDQATHFGSDASFSWPTVGSNSGIKSGLTPNDPTLAKRIETDAQGNVKKIVNKYPSTLDTQVKEADLKKKQDSLPFLKDLLKKK